MKPNPKPKSAESTSHEWVCRLRSVTLKLKRALVGLLVDPCSKPPLAVAEMAGQQALIHGGEWWGPSGRLQATWPCSRLIGN